MGLYLLVPGENEGDELAGFQVGTSTDFDVFRAAVAELESGDGSRATLSRLLGRRRSTSFPTLMHHSNADGEWTPVQCHDLLIELVAIHDEFERLPARPFAPDSWQANVASEFGLTPTSLADSFVNVDGEPLLSAMRRLAAIAIEHRRPIRFQ